MGKADGDEADGDGPNGLRMDTDIAQLFGLGSIHVGLRAFPISVHQCPSVVETLYLPGSSPRLSGRRNGFGDRVLATGKEPTFLFMLLRTVAV